MAAMPTTQADRIATVHRFIAAVEERDALAASQCLTDELMWRIPGNSRVSGEYRGPAGFIQLSQNLRSLSNGTFQSRNEDVLIGERGTIAVLQRNTAERDDRTLNVRGCYLLEFEGERISSGQACYEDEAEASRFWS